VVSVSCRLSVRKSAASALYAFVPEGQADRSQARSAWVSMQRPVPEGRLKSLSVPQIFVVETELMPLQKRQVLLSKSLVNPGR
jgi:hypothetical protein